MRPLAHLTCGVLVAAGQYLLKKEPETSIGCVLGSVLCDTDHIFEYAEYCNEYNVQPDFYEWNSGEYFSKKGTVKVFFHSWELCILSWIILILIRGKKNSCSWRILKGIIMGYTSHMVLDQIGNGMNGKCYFLLYRLIHGCKQKELGSA